MAEINILLHAKNGRILENTTTNMRNTLPRPESQLPLTHAQLAPRNHHLLDLSVREIYSSFTDKTVHQHRLWRHHWRRFIFSLSFSRYCSHHKFNGMTKCMRSPLLTLIFISVAFSTRGGKWSKLFVCGIDGKTLKWIVLFYATDNSVLL